MVDIREWWVGIGEWVGEGEDRTAAEARPDFVGISGGGGKIFRGDACSGVAHNPHGKLGPRTGRSQRCDICMWCTYISVY